MANVHPRRVARTALFGVWLMATALTTACGSSSIQYHLSGAPNVVTQVTLHPDMTRKRLYSTNYQQPGLIPICTPVEILEVNAKLMRFRAEGVEYHYLFDNHLVAPPQEHLDRILGTECPDLSGFGAKEQENIRAGRVEPGMSRQAVLLALGPPPDHANRMDAPVWKYWRHRFDTFDVAFENDEVVEIRN